MPYPTRQTDMQRVIQSHHVNRRELLRRSSMGFGLGALAGLLSERQSAAAPTADPGLHRSHLTPAKARSVIFCYMSGGVSHVDSFDPKPLLQQYAGQAMPMAVQRTQFNNNGTVQPSHWAFKSRGQSGTAVSDLFPHIGSVIDDIAVVRGMTAKFSEHAQGNFFMHTGFPFLGYPSTGAWCSYGLGNESRNLPSYVVLQSGDATTPHGGVGLFSNGFLPAMHQASVLKADVKEAVRNITPWQSADNQRDELSFIQSLDGGFLQRVGPDTHLESAISNYEMAWRMQAAVPDLCEIKGETAATLARYGVDSADRNMADYGRQCLLARRLVERGVRFIELSCLANHTGGGNGPNPWDHHGKLKLGHGNMGRQVDQPIAALLRDLKARGLLDSTLVVWAGEFGRTPFAQGSDGRDHNPYGFSIWLAGGGIKGGTVLGATDDFGYYATEQPQTVYDLWATVLFLLGIDHEQLTYRFGGRDIRLTDVHGKVMRPILA